jgi:hypothetical protein
MAGARTKRTFHENFSKAEARPSAVLSLQNGIKSGRVKAGRPPKKNEKEQVNLTTVMKGNTKLFYHLITI